ncbi:MAG: 3'-5' exonuclease [Acidobacteriota bacterium]
MRWSAPWNRWRRALEAPELWALDLETTGLDALTDHVLSVGMVPVRDRAICWGERWSRRVQAPDDEVWTEAVGIHELLPAEATDALSLDALVDELADRLGDSVLLVHFGALDVTMLQRLFAERGRRWTVRHVVDTTHLLRRLDRRRRLIEPGAVDLPTQLGAARDALGLPPHDEHHALYDALATAELFLALRARLAPEAS